MKPGEDDPWVSWQYLVDELWAVSTSLHHVMKNPQGRHPDVERLLREEQKAITIQMQSFHPKRWVSYVKGEFKL